MENKTSETAAGIAVDADVNGLPVDFRWIVQEDAEAVVVVDADFRYRYLNREAERWLNRTFEELQGKIAWDVFPDAVGTVTYHAQIKAMRTREECRYQSVYNPFGVIFEARCLPSADGGLVVRWRDVHAQKQAEATVLQQAETLRQKEERLRLAVGAGHMGAWDIDLATGRASIDAVVSAMFGRDDVRDIDSHVWPDWIHPEDRARVTEQFATAVTGAGHEYSMEYRAIWPDGETIRRLAVHATIERDAQAVATRIVGICQDVTEERNVQDARDAALSQLRAVLSSASDGIIVSDLAGNILLMNPAALRLHDFTNLSDAQRHFLQFAEIFSLQTTEGEVLPVSQWPLARLLRGQTFTDCALSLHRSDLGRRRWVSYGGSVAHGADGQPLLLVLALRDITEQRRLLEREAELRHEVEAAAHRQRRFLREMMNAMTDGRLHLCDTPDELPARLALACEPIPLSARTLRLLRRDATQAAADLGFDDGRTQDLQTSVGEAAMNAVVHACGGIGQVFQNTDQGIVQVWVTDTGNGITEDALHRATLERGYSSAGTLGHGFWMMIKTADRVHLLTGPTGTTVVLEQERDAPLPGWLKPISPPEPTLMEVDRVPLEAVYNGSALR